MSQNFLRYTFLHKMLEDRHSVLGNINSMNSSITDNFISTQTHEEFGAESQNARHNLQLSLL